MQTYDLIIIGTGSAMNIINPYFERKPQAKVAMIDKDEPGGICLNKGCVPSKVLLYPAELIQTVQKFSGIGIECVLGKIHFKAIMERMRLLIGLDVLEIKQSLENANGLDYFHGTAEFVSPYVLRVSHRHHTTTIKGNTIILCTGSCPYIPDIVGLETMGYHTSASFLELDALPSSWVIIGGGYVAAEYGHFLQSMGARVTIIGRNPQFLKDEEPEVSDTARGELGKRMEILTGWEVIEVARTEKVDDGGTRLKQLKARNVSSGEEKLFPTEEILVAAGRSPLTSLLRPENGGIETDEAGWIKVDKYLRTSQKNVWAIGDAIGPLLFKHVANHESEILYYNTVANNQELRSPDYAAVPHAVFTYPEIAAVGTKESEAIEKYGEDDIAIGFALYNQTAKGMAMDLQDNNYFVKVIVQRSTATIVGAHVIGLEASVLIHEIIAAMNASDRRFPFNMMHIHPALNEVVAKAFGQLMRPADYHHYWGHLTGKFGPNHDH